MATSASGSDRTRTPKGYTPPKGAPTRARGQVGGRRRLFGPVAQWIALAIAIVVVVAIIIALTGGGDFNPLDDDSLGGAAVSLVAGVLGR